MLRRTHVALVLLAAALAACGGGYGSGGGGPTDPGDGRTVTASNALRFGPATLTVHAGDVVTFAFGSIAHNVAGAPTDIAGTNANVSVQRTFTTAGNFHYPCHIHPGMQGTVVVQ